MLIKLDHLPGVADYPTPWLEIHRRKSCRGRFHVAILSELEKGASQGQVERECFRSLCVPGAGITSSHTSATSTSPKTEMRPCVFFQASGLAPRIAAAFNLTGMAHYTATVHWERGDQRFVDNRYSRGHVWRFDGGVEVPASSSPGVIPLPLSRADAVDPEEAFVASLSSCHMLWFLSLAAKAGFTVDSYEDQAEGIMAKNGKGKLAMTRVTLRPLAVFSGVVVPDRVRIEALHQQAHEECFIASSVLTEVGCEPR